MSPAPSYTYPQVYIPPRRRITRVFIHCSDSDRPAHDDITVVRRWHTEERSFSDVGYHFFITTKGVIQTGRHLERTPAAQRGHNRNTIAICLAGTAPAEHNQLAQLYSLCRTLRKCHGEHSVTFHGHCEVSTKTCPNFDYRGVLGLTAKGYLRAP